MNLLRYFFTLLVTLPLLCDPLSAQRADGDGQFYLDFAGSAVFPYNPKGQLGHGVKAGAGFTAAFGYAFKEGFSTEIEWGAPESRHRQSHRKSLPGNHWWF